MGGVWGALISRDLVVVLPRERRGPPCGAGWEESLAVSPVEPGRPSGFRAGPTPEVSRQFRSCLRCGLSCEGRHRSRDSSLSFPPPPQALAQRGQFLSR